MRENVVHYFSVRLFVIDYRTLTLLLDRNIADRHESPFVKPRRKSFKPHLFIGRTLAEVCNFRPLWISSGSMCNGFPKAILLTQWEFKVGVWGRKMLWNVLKSIFHIWYAVKLLVVTNPCKHPLLLCEQFSKMPKVSKSILYVWTTFKATTSCKPPQPLLELKLWNFPLFLTWKQILDR